MMRRAVVALALVLGCLSAVALAPTSTAATCFTLQPEDVRYGAPHLVGETAVDPANADCYRLPGGPGATYGWVEQRPGVKLAFQNADGGRACSSVGDICRLQGPAPYTARVLSEARFPYEVNLVRLDGDNACPPGAVPAFGESSPSMRIAAAEPWLACRAVEMRAGRHLVFSYSGNWNLLTSDGEAVCDFFEEPFLRAMCTVPRAGDYRLVSRHLGDTTPGFEGARFSIAFLGPGAVGCQPSLDTSWSSPAVSQRVDTNLQVDCHAMPGNPGDRVGFGGGPEVPTYPAAKVETEVVDAAGRLVCDDLAEPGYGCLLEGSPPYRLISWVSSALLVEPDAGYVLAARSLDPALGCPLVTEATPFNTPVSGLHRGAGCWQYDVAPGEEIRPVVGKVTSSGIDAGEERLSGVGALLGPDFVSRCSYGGCRSTSPGRHTVVTNLKGGEHVLGIYRWPDSRGCRPLATDFTTLRGALDGAQMMCVLLDVPDGWGMGVVLATPDEDLLMARWYNAAGENICEGDFARVTVCTAQGPGPYHVIVGDGGAHDYIISAFDYQPPLSPPQECVDTRLGESVQLSLSAQTSTVCFLAGPSGMGEDISVDRIDGSGRFQLIRIAGGGSCDDNILDFTESAQLGCAPSSGGSATRRAITVVGDGGTATLSVIRTETSPEPEPVTLRNLQRPTLLGKAWVGRTLRAKPGAWTPAGTRYYYVWHVAGRRLPGTTNPKLKLIPRFRGKPITVAVVAVRAGYDPGLAFSKPVTVRRKP
jgi:hypothetical protein